MTDTVNVLILIAIAAVTITLGFGIYALFRGGEFGRTWSNKLMRLRVVLQATALALLALGAFIASRAGG
ncbi:twin transmembrane helix small protein [Brevundimonas sp.]|uniref:twin transmembrane helix small protein n=1 Tax=Brevundimonas sp. TaxID=1871086 RepID=UPI0025E16213|nr:twin transmembrane helix small protein [Brevundimonas sp.]